MHDMIFGYDRLMRILEVAILVYTPWALFIIVRNPRIRKDINKSESRSLVYIISVYAFDGWYNWRYTFYEGRAWQCIDGKWGYINRLHSVVVPHMFDLAWNFNDGLACVGIGENNNKSMAILIAREML